MTVYSFTDEYTPPAPFVYVNLRNGENGYSVQQYPAQVDTGADRTILPERLADALQLRKIGEAVFSGLAGRLSVIPLHLVLVAIHTDLRGELVEVEVASSSGEEWIILGRDVLNRYRFTFDGPAKKHTIES